MKNKIRHITFLTDGIYPFVQGGMQKYAYYYIAHLLSKGIDVNLFHCVLPGSPVPDENEVVKELKKTNLVFTGRLKSVCVIFPKRGFFPGHYLRNSYRYSALIFEKMYPELHQTDFVFIQGFSGWKFLEERNKRQIKVAAGVHFHGLNMFQKSYNYRMKWHSFLFKKPVCGNMQKADIVFSLGGVLDNYLIRNAGINKEKIIHAPAGINKNWLDNNSTENNDDIFRFLFIGRDDRIKGIDEYLKAIETAMKKLSVKAEFHFIGDLSQSAGNKKQHLFFHGEIKNEEILKNEISKYDVLICPSLSEGFPMVILESFACSVPVIATNVGAIGSIVNTDNGWLIPPGNTTCLADAIIDATRHSKSALREKGKTGYSSVKHNFTWDIVVNNLLIAIEEWLDRNYIFNFKLR